MKRGFVPIKFPKGGYMDMANAPVRTATGLAGCIVGSMRRWLGSERLTDCWEEYDALSIL